MITSIRIASKLTNDGFKVGMPDTKALEILGHCVAPVACRKFYAQNKAEILETLTNWENHANNMNALNKLIQERFADITQGASADVYPLTVEELEAVEFECLFAADCNLPVGTDFVDEQICDILEKRR